MAALVWRCVCGGVLDVAAFPAGPTGPAGSPGSAVLEPAVLAGRAATMWRYGEVLPVAFDPGISLGEGMTPLVDSGTLPGVRLKLDFLMPTLSFKDRGAVVLATLAARLGVASALVDSSGNAGTAAAAYFARAGIPCRVLVPAATSPAKLAQMRAHGASVTLVPGSRADTAAAAVAAAAEPGVMYASHVFHPYFAHGVKTYGYEIWEQYGRTLPDTVVVPVGNGTLVLGCHLAFSELVAAGLAPRMPVIVAVQAAGCAPLARAVERGADIPVGVDAGTTVAEGIAIAAPPRGEQILRAVRATGGTVVAVPDQEIAAARTELAARGVFVEPTAAVCWAAVRAARTATGQTRGPAEAAARTALTAPEVVVPLCGAGLKSPAPGAA
ncbi:pyridoxal-phosphate dependent enzyme [Streptomyces sp. NPDC093085]|uniref:pyridoxal-phosphate dependent enzyme n=1 Tax=Streptomyces sp. NPDC093085 TaxID=3155068 RepID=UPI00341544D5